MRHSPYSLRSLPCTVMMAGAWLSLTVWAGVANAQPPRVARVNDVTPLPAGPPIGHFNLHLVATEEWLNRVIARNDVNEGVVDDCILGAKVDGQQITNSSLRLDIRPSDENIAAAFVLTGNICTQTRGLTEQATIFSRGQQQFQAAKDIFFDGMVFSTRHAVVSVRAHNENLGASTRFDGTALQPLVSQFVLRAAEQRRPAAEEIARNKVADRIYPRFDQDVDDQLSKANQQLENVVRKRLNELGVMPSAQRCRSTDNELHYAVRVAAEADPFEIVSPSTPLLGVHGLRLYVHSSLFDAAALKAGLAGLNTSDKQLDRLLARFGVASEDEGGPTAGIETQIEFDAQRPLTVIFDNDEMVVELRAKLRPAGQALLPPLILSLPFRVVEQDSQRLLRPGTVGVQARGEDGRPPATLPPAIETAVRQAISANLKDLPLPDSLPASAWISGKTPPKLSSLRFRDGWMALGLD